jgi:hypothetical protein
MNVNANENLILGAQSAIYPNSNRWWNIYLDFFLFFFCTQITNKIQQITWKIKVLYTETYN